MTDPSCPIQTQNHFEHDEKIRELSMENETLKFAMERTPRLLVVRLLQLEKELESKSMFKERSKMITEIKHLRQENADLIKQQKEINKALQDAEMIV